MLERKEPTLRLWDISAKHRVCLYPIIRTEASVVKTGLGQPLGLWRDVSKDDSIPQAHGSSIAVHAGERIFADFSKAHTDVGVPIFTEKTSSDQHIILAHSYH